MFQDRIEHETELFIDHLKVDAIDCVTDGGVQSAVSHLGSNIVEDVWMPFIAIGSGITEPSTTDIVLEHELYRKRGVVTVINNTYFIEAEFGLDEPLADIIFREVGIFSEYTGGIMGARWLLVEDVIKEFDNNIVVKCAISLL